MNAYRCCEHCDDDPVHDVEKDQHTVDCDLCRYPSTRTEAQIKAEALREVADTLGHATYCQPDPDRDPYRGCSCLISILYARANLLDPEGGDR